MTRDRKATLILLLTTVIWGSSFPIARMGLDAMAGQVAAEGRWLIPIWLTAARMILAMVVFVLVCPRALLGFRRRDLRDSLWIALPGAVGITLGGWGLQQASVTVTAFLTNLTVVFTPVLGFLFFRERLARALILGATVAFGGVVVLTNPSGGAFGWPETLVLLSSLCFALQIQLIPLYTKDRDPEAMTFGVLLHFTWLMFLPLLVLPAGRSMLSLRFFQPLAEGRWIDRWAVLGSTVYLAVLASSLAVWVFMRYQREIPATRAAILYSCEPVFAALLSGLVLYEPMGWRKLAGGALILGGNLVCELGKKSAPTAIVVPQDDQRAGAGRERDPVS